MNDRGDNQTRRPWTEPALTRHDSLTALTRQYRDPYTGRPLDPNNPADMAIIQQIPGSEGFFP